MKIASLISFALAAVACLSVTTEAGYKHKHVHSWKHDQCTALGGIISHDGIACCHEQCGQCNSHGCNHEHKHKRTLFNNQRDLQNSKHSKHGGNRLNPHHCCPEIICHYGNECGTTGYAPCCLSNSPTMAPTPAPTTEAPTTEAPTTEAPTTEAPTTEAPTTEAPTTEAPTTEAPTTEAPTTEAPTTEAPTTEAPTTEVPTTEAPTTEAPTTEAPTTEAPTEAPTCETYGGLHGVVGDRMIEVCCDSRCGVCGGADCDTRGTPNGRHDCCRTDIVVARTKCSESGAAPCVLSEGDDGLEAICISYGGILGATDEMLVCCDPLCGECGGVGCQYRPGGALNCCAGHVVELQPVCDIGVTAPCSLPLDIFN